MTKKHPDDIMKEAIKAWKDAHNSSDGNTPGVVMVNLGTPGTNSDPIGGGELFLLLSKPTPEVRDIAKGILDRMCPPNPHIRAPLAIAALTFALAEVIAANASPPELWAKTVGERLRDFVTW
jgi:hypothetical protein